jgi:hypothetical protein
MARKGRQRKIMELVPIRNRRATYHFTSKSTWLSMTSIRQNQVDHLFFPREVRPPPADKATANSVKRDKTLLFCDETNSLIILSAEYARHHACLVQNSFISDHLNGREQRVLTRIRGFSDSTWYHDNTSLAHRRRTTNSKAKIWSLWYIQESQKLVLF